MGTTAELVRLAPPPRWRLTAAVALGALTIIFGVGLMALAGYLISRAAQRPAVLSLMVVIVGVRFFGLGRPIIRYLERLASHDLALRVLGRVRLRVYERIEPLAPAQLDAYRTGDLLSRMVSDVDALQNLYLRALEPPLVAMIAGAVSVGVAAAVLPAAGVILATGLLAAGAGVPLLSAALARRAARRQAAARGELSAALVELTTAAGELVALGAEAQVLADVRDLDRRLVRIARRDALATGIADGLGLAITGATVCGVLLVAAAASGRHGIDPVMIAMLGLLALASFEAVTPLAAAARELGTTRSAGRRVLELTAEEAIVRDPPAPAAAPTWPFAVAIEDVTASYPGQPLPAVEHLTLRAEPGERIAILGRSGAGKTTMTNLLLRFLDPEAGCVTLGGRDVREYAQADVRRAFALAGQESHLFSTSIRENLLLARPDADDDALERVLRQARIWEWVRQLPSGLDTPVGECGSELSGGQRQRLVVARALLSGAPVLILDEPTAHLDPPTARALVADVLAAAGDRTVLLITHRDEGLELVDRVVTLAARPEDATVVAVRTA